MNLTGYQVKQLADFMGGDFDTNVTIEDLPARTLDAGTGAEPTVLPAGVWVWCTDYPEEGGVLLDREEPANDPRAAAVSESFGYVTHGG